VKGEGKQSFSLSLLKGEGRGEGDKQ
jgi:hypothetical protein